MSAATYTIRYRSALHPDSVRLVLEDVSGEYYLFSCHPDHCSLHPMPAEERSEADLTRFGWQPVSDVASLSFDALRSLMTGALITHHLPPFLDPPAANGAKARRD